MSEKIKKFPTVACCGIDCGLCPRFHTKGSSACPGCGGKNFKEKHPSCGCLTCCVQQHGLDVCAECPDYPCRRFSQAETYDSFVTHANMSDNLAAIKERGIRMFVRQQAMRMNVLTEWLEHYDDGRSKSLFCLSCALLPLDQIKKLQKFAGGLSDTLSVKQKNQLLRDELAKLSKKTNIALRLKTKQS